MTRSYSQVVFWPLAMLLSGLLTFAAPSTQAEEAEAPNAKAPDAKAADAPAPKIQIALLLDTSNSMDGLINQAKTTLWRAVNQYASARRNGQPIQLEVALFEYGNDTLPRHEGHIRMAVPFTENLDLVSEELFKLTTNGGQEYCGQVIDQAVRELAWDENATTLKCIFIAGNEPFSQGPIAYAVACRAATGRNITVNTIHCGTYEEGAGSGWEEGAKLADGSYMSINPDRQIVQIAAPQDEELVRLSEELNRTYVAYGAAPAREAAVARQEAQDENAAQLSSETAAERASFKGKEQYDNRGWDLVDACNNNHLAIEDVPEDQLPEELKNKSLEERKQCIAEKTEKRTQLQAEINRLSAERMQYIAAEQAKRAAEQPAAEASLDSVMLRTVRAQAEAKEYEFVEE